MRFLPNGPSIPNILLDARDEGEVVFLCGAGVSIPAGLPSFQLLAQLVIEDLGAPEEAKSQRLLQRSLRAEDLDDAPPMDQLFSHLQREYGVEEVERAVARRLRRPKNAMLTRHETILRLSASKNGTARVVTTNFDLLFEAAQPRLAYSQPPNLPRLRANQSLDGLVYLHGRLPRTSKTKGGVRGLVLSVADFGRAYLAHGWAAQFVRELLDHYIVVLLGYRAEDPPMRYLLEELNAVGGAKTGQLFAFSEGAPAEVEAAWQSRGVTAISYPESPQHVSLWDTLSAWAERARDPERWRKAIVDLAYKGPRSVEPYQRGQVAALCQSTIGGHEFAEANPPPPSEWLCVLDSWVRYMKPRASVVHAAEEYDPLAVYGLDDDPPRATAVGPETPPPTGVNILASLGSTESLGSGAELSGPLSHQASDLPPRLLRLAWWISKVSDEPAALWWAAGRAGIHARLKRNVELRNVRSHGSATPVIRQGWRLLLEAFEESRDRFKWRNLAAAIEEEGWTNANLRAFERGILPALRVSRPRYSAPRPPEKNPADLRLEDLLHLEVVFPDRPNLGENVRDDALVDVTKALRRALERAGSLLRDIAKFGYRVPTLHPQDTAEQVHHGSGDRFFLWFSKLFERLCELKSQRPSSLESAPTISEHAAQTD